MSLSLYQRITISLSLVFIVMSSIVFWWSGNLQQQTKLESEQRLHSGLAEHLVQDNPLLAEGVYDYKALENLFHMLMVLGPSFEFYYLDPHGKIITYSADPGKVLRTHVDIAPIKSMIENPNILPILGDDPRNHAKQKIFSAAPVLNNGELQGYLYMIIGGELSDNITEAVNTNQGMRDVTIIASSALIFILIVLFVLLRAFTRPLKNMSCTIQKAQSENDYQQLDFGYLSNSSNDEIRQLANAFNALVSQLKEQYQQLQNIDEHRRTLLADLSHDLRTPLASLQGYIETLYLRGDNLNSEERARFVQISHKNANNLKRLIDQIFELAYLEGNQITLNQESFPIGELLYDVVAKFDLKARAKSIELQVNPSQFDYQVFADIGKLERVLTNLIENAIRHTPENGRIFIEVEVANQKDTQQSKLRINVRDTGIGISKKEIAYIFDARYRATNSIEDKTPHAGLGLAISKKLMNLLNSDLEVESELGKGTCFSFELSLAN